MPGVIFQPLLMGGGTWHTAFTNVASFNANNTGWGGYTAIEIIPANTSSFNGSQIRITLYPVTAGNSGTLTGVYAGHAGGSQPYSFDGTQVQIKFAGSGTPTLTAGGSPLLSDAVPYTFDKTKAFCVAFQTPATMDLRGVNPAAAGSEYYATPGDAPSVQNKAAGYVNNSAYHTVGLIEVFY